MARARMGRGPAGSLVGSRLPGPKGPIRSACVAGPRHREPQTNRLLPRVRPPRGPTVRIHHTRSPSRGSGTPRRPPRLDRERLLPPPPSWRHDFRTGSPCSPRKSWSHAARLRWWAPLSPKARARRGRPAVALLAGAGAGLPGSARTHRAVGDGKGAAFGMTQEIGRNPLLPLDLVRRNGLFSCHWFFPAGARPRGRRCPGDRVKG
jgi:hypothetical protein